MHPMLNVAFQAARTASRDILDAMQRMDKVQIDMKGHHDYVTSIDRHTETVLMEAINKTYPRHHIITEESGVHSGKDSDVTWIIDPIDGTTNFIHGFPQFAISIAIRFGDKIEHGMVYDVTRDELYTASIGKGAQLNNRRLRVSQCIKPEHALLSTGFPFKNEDMYREYFKSFDKIFPKVSDIRRAGSAALDLAFVAAGRLDGYWEGDIKPWDIAAGALLVQEAGGRVSDYAGSSNFLTSGNIIAGTPKMFEFITAALKD